MVKIDAPGLEISLNLWNMENKTRGIDLEWSWSHRKLKKGSYKGSKVKTKICLLYTSDAADE